ncbi:hypothetical protein G7Z17_g3571 [Cylindrodendrum hubeiense]|uniref:Major facilitator superfamily (MFS) profile domain-containing protein n=1 Tax=Cylindrodendrum hubeiense TaxID=595255 RepID=A0A9P5HKV2_9HYPO|nr:hypothetical protein G7Z17_g3571 [Cylindrodendrum hubeiense]
MNGSSTDDIDQVESQSHHDAASRERNLLWKIDWHVLPWLCIAYALSLIDRTNIAAAKIVGMELDLNLHDNMYSVALLVFFVTYILTEIPSNAIVERLGTRIYLAILLAGWGAVAMCFGFVKNYGQLVALRVLLGFFEGGFNPACIFVISSGSYSLAFFVPSILSSFGFNVALSQILTTPPYIFSAIVSVATGIVADRVKIRSPFIIAYSLLVIIGLVMIGWGHNTGARLAGIFLAVTGNNCAIPSALAFLSNNVVDTRKRQFAVPIQTVFGGVGGIIGALVFRQQDYPGYRPSLYASIGCMGLNIVLAGGLAFYLARQNQKADDNGEVLEAIPEYRYTL